MLPFELDGVLLARIQFAFTISFHIIFPALSIGLASWLAVVEWRWLKTGNPVYEQVYRQWIKIFAVSFGLGVVSGVVMAYQFGTNWSFFSEHVANVIGPLLGYEVLTAFFLEASFLGIMLFGWGRVSKRMHFASTVIVAVGTLISAFWILAANSWMQTPAGFEVGADGLLYPTDWLAIIFNPSFPYRLIHMILAAYLTTAFVVGGVGALYLLRKKYKEHAKIMLGMATIMAAIAAPAQMVVGDMHGLNTLEHQPLKVAAMEGIWENEQGAALRLFAVPDQENQANHYEIAIPKLASYVLTHHWDGEVKGIKNWPEEEHPPVAITFYSFRIMVGLGLLMILTGLIGAVLYFRKQLFENRLFHRWVLLMSPSGFVALLAGWFVTEVGRQPYLVYGMMRTSDGVSPVIPEQVAISLLAFIIVYSLLFGAGLFYIIKLVHKGPAVNKKPQRLHKPGRESAVTSTLTKGDA